MTIVAECPHCESKFNLQPQMLGKSMRCPNLSCRNVFTVTNLDGSTTLPAVVDAQVVEAEVVEGVVEARVVGQPQELQWSKSMSTPSRRLATAIVDDDEPMRMRRKKRRWSKPLIAGSVAAIIFLLAAGGYVIYRMNALGESKLARQADEALKNGDYPAAAKAYRELIAEFPSSSELPRYQFSEDLASMRAAVQSITNREDPFPALEKFRAFVDKYRDSPLAKPQSGLGSDIHAAGSKLIDDLAEHAKDRLTKYRADRSQSGELDRAARAVDEGLKLLKAIEPFSDPGITASESSKIAIEGLDRDVGFERGRAKFVAELREGLKEPSDESIAQAEGEANRRGLGGEADVVQIFQEARASLRERVRYKANRRPPQPTPAVAGTSFLFATPIGRAAPLLAAPGESPGTFLAMARGILYALDERTGELLWAQRVGADTTDPPTRYAPDDGSGDVALVTSDVAGVPGLTARRLRTGEALWHQPLPARAAGPAVVVARRVYVPTRDDRGTVVEIDLGSGTQLGSIALGQPLATAAAPRAGTGLLYIPADARRVFVLDVDARNDDGARLEPRLVQLLNTGHAPGSLRIPPVIAGPEGSGPERRWLVLIPTDGPRSTRLRAFALPEEAAGATSPEFTLPAAVEHTVPGWPWFPPAFDGERLALATDAGQVRLFGVGQPGADDRPLYPMASPPAAKEASDDPIPALALSNSDDGLWALTAGRLTHYRLVLDPARGQVLRPIGEPSPIGMPTQPAQLSANRDAAFFVVRAGGTRAVAWDLVENRELWTRQLGLLPSVLPVLLEGHLFLADEAGGLTLVPRGAFDPRAAGDHVAEAKWKLAPAPANVTGPTILLPVAEGFAAWAITPHEAAFTIRRVEDGKLELDTKVNTPARLAGMPIEVNETLLFPLADGFVYRLDPNNGRLVPGPVWRDARVKADAVCYLALVQGDEFLASDGNREIRRWLWASDGSDWKRVGERIVSRESIATPPLVLPGAGKDGETGVLFADRTGSAWLHSLATGEVVRRWRSGGGGPIPAGPPSSTLRPLQSVLGLHSVAYIVDGRTLVSIDPTKEGVKVATVPGGVAGTTFLGDPGLTDERNWFAIDLTGRCFEFSSATLEPIAERSCGAIGAWPVLGGTMVEGHGVAVPLADGTVSVISMEAPKPVAPKPRSVDAK